MSIEITTEKIAGALAVSQHSTNIGITEKYAKILSVMPLNVPLTAEEINNLLAPIVIKLKEKLASIKNKPWNEWTEEEEELYCQCCRANENTFSFQQISWFGKFMQKVGYVKVERVSLDEPYEIKIPYARYNYETRQYEEKEKVIKVDTITKYTRIV